jgi:hypothetical protein
MKLLLAGGKQRMQFDHVKAGMVVGSALTRPEYFT